MKKSLLAFAAIGAFASAAQAQSSVTVYGILDVGYVGSSYKGTSATANASSVGNPAEVGNALKSQTMNSIGQSAESTSRLGFRGTEDLGGGTSAIFTVETALNPNGASASSGFQFNRQAFVGLSKKGMGTVSVGNQYLPIFDLAAQTDAAGLNNLVGNAIYSGSLQSSTGTYDQGLGPWNGQGTANSGLTAMNSAFVTRASNQVKFVSDTFAGIQATLSYATSSSTASGATVTSTGQANSANNTVAGAGLNYKLQKLQVVAAYQTFRAWDPAAAAYTTAAATLANGTAGSFGSNNNDAQSYAAATYDFGILKAYAQFGNRKVISVVDSAITSTRTASQVGVRGNITPVISAYATAGMGNSTLYGASIPKQNFRMMQIGSDYYLSKRTNLYVAYGSYNQSSNGTNTAYNANTAAGLGNIATSGANYAAGIRHTF